MTKKFDNIDVSSDLERPVEVTFIIARALMLTRDTFYFIYS